MKTVPEVRLIEGLPRENVEMVEGQE